MHRQVLAFEGKRETTRAAAGVVLAEFTSERVLWVGPEDCPPSRVRRLLGGEFDALVLDLHESVEADLLGQAAGLIRGGGVLLLRLPEDGVPRSPNHLAAAGASQSGVRSLFGTRLVDGLSVRPVAAAQAVQPPPATPRMATIEQDAAVRVLEAALFNREAVVVLAGRGRGKSRALARAAHGLGGRAVVVGLDPEAHREVRSAGPAHLEVRSVRSFLEEGATWDAVLIDEAARIAVPLLQRIAVASSSAGLVLASTTDGYEGTGRGLRLRFLPWLAQRRPVTTVGLRTPIRWWSGDPVEDWLAKTLCLNAAPPCPDPDGPVQFLRLPPRQLAEQPGLLEAVFSLLVQAHYRTTPSDLQRLLDAPSIHVFAALDAQGNPLAVNLINIEGDFGAEDAVAFQQGRQRMVGHALADSLVVHLGRADAGRLRIMRSVRLATHPAARRRGLATRLVRTAERWAQEEKGVSLAGTLFGATSAVLRFRQSAGYHLVRGGGSAGARTGAPTAAMLRPLGAPAKMLLADLRTELGWALPVQLDLLRSEVLLSRDDDVLATLAALAPTPGPPPSIERCAAALEGALFGPRTLDSVQWAVEKMLGGRPFDTQLPPLEAALVHSRVVRRASWEATRCAAGLPSIRATQRALKRALRTLLSD